MAIPHFPELPFESPSEGGVAIYFYPEDVDFDLTHPQAVSKWLLKVVEQEGKELVSLTYVFCSDEYLFRLNQEYLQHDTYTDVITFPYGEENEIEGDIFISIERVKENAATFKTSFERELHRVMVHGLLHLCGYGDKGEEESSLMRKMESDYLRQLEEV